MPSAFDTLFSSYAKPMLFRQFGSTVTYTMETGAALPITAIVGAEASELMEMPGDRSRYRHRTVEVSTVDVPAPKTKVNRVTVDGEEWTVHAVLGIQLGKAWLQVVRPERTEAGGRVGGRR